MFKTNRQTTYPVHELILNRWSPRAFSNEPLSDQELMSLFEAARWAQNSYNNQPWAFVYSLKNSDSWQLFLELLVPANREWAQYAPVLVIAIAKTTFDYNNKPSRTHSFDVGAACQNMALQGASLDIIVHGMEGFDYERAKIVAKIPQDYAVQAMFAVGKIGPKQILSPILQKRENPSDRKALHSFVFEDEFKK